MEFTLSMSAFSIKEWTMLHKKIDAYESLGFSFSDNWYANPNIIKINIDTLEDLENLQRVVWDELIIDFVNMSIEIYNSYRE